MKKIRIKEGLFLNKQIISNINSLKGGAAPDDGAEADIYTEARTCREDQLSLPHSECNCWKF